MEKRYQAAQDMKRRYEEATAQAKENNRLILERLSAYRIPVQPPKPPTAREIRRAEHEKRKRRREQEDQFLQHIYRGETTVFTPTGLRWEKWDPQSDLPSQANAMPRNAPSVEDARMPGHNNSISPSTTPNTAEGKDSLAQDPQVTEEDWTDDDEFSTHGNSTKRKRFAWNDWMLDTDDEAEPPKKRRCRRLANGDKVAETQVILPGGYFKIEVETLVEDARPPRRRKRDEAELDLDDNEEESLCRIAERRLVRRRVEEVSSSIALDPEVLVVKRFIKIAARYASYDKFEESHLDCVKVEPVEEARISDAAMYAPEKDIIGSPSTASEIEDDSGYFSAENDKHGDNKCQDSADRRFTAREKGKMPVEGPRSRSRPCSALYCEGVSNDDDFQTAYSASAGPQNTGRGKGKMHVESSRKKTPQTEDLTSEVKAKIVKAVVAAAERRLRLPTLRLGTPIELGEGE
ncbi:hypothetical protein NCC49_002154 [Naganishia albida]|nr:hypothetical protein NCC49_002154 [Naganishia albida]